jgi:histidinol-phosphate aminotransferase
MKLRKALETIVPYTPGKLKEGAIKLASNENPLGPSPKAMQCIKAMAENVYLYPDAGCNRLRETVAAKIGMAPENLIFGNGSDEVLCLIAGAYIEEGCNAVTSETTFSEYTFATVLFGGKMKYAPMKEGRFQLDAIADLVDGSTRIAFLCNPNNPTGTIFTGAELESFMKRIPRDVLVVCDEAYFEYVGRKDFPDSIALLKEYPNLIILRTFSKIYGLAGLRVGYGIADEKVVLDLLKAKTPFNVNIVAQEAAIAATADDEFVERSVRVNSEGKAFLYREFDKLGLSYYPSEANFVCVRVGKDCMEVFQKIMDLGVTIRPMKSFGLLDRIRVTVGTPEQNAKFLDCLKKVL